MGNTVDDLIIRESSLGDELSVEESKVLANTMGCKVLKDGEILVPEGGSDNTLFLLADGNLVVTSNIEGEEKLVYTMKKGECAGTRAFVDKAPRQATLRASGNTTVYSLEPTKFESLLEQHPRVVYKVMRAIFRITHSNLMRMNFESQALSRYITRTGGRY